MRDGSDAVVFGYGPWLLANAFEAAEELEQSDGREHAPRQPAVAQSRRSRAGCAKSIGDRRTIVTLDNHYLQGGQGEMLAAAIAELGLEPRRASRRVGVTELPECGTNDEVLAHHGLDVAGLVDRSALRSTRRSRVRSHDRSVLGYRRHAADHRQGRRAGVGSRPCAKSTGQRFRAGQHSHCRA